MHEQHVHSGKLATSSMVDLTMTLYSAFTNPETSVAWQRVFLQYLSHTLHERCM